MILTVNLGNTHITIGGYEHDDLKFCGRLHTDPAATVDEYALRLVNLLSLHRAVPSAFRCIWWRTSTGSKRQQGSCCAKMAGSPRWRKSPCSWIWNRTGCGNCCSWHRIPSVWKRRWSPDVHLSVGELAQGHSGLRG